MCMKRPCKCSCALVPVPNDYSSIAHGPEGAFAWGTVRVDGRDCTQIRVKLPNEGGQYHALIVYQEGEARPTSQPSWKWNGNKEHPTLEPSIRTRLPSAAWLERDDDRPCTDADMEESWHGFITNGRAVSC